MNIQAFTPMFLYMVISSFTPGPGNILALNTMASQGWKKGRGLLLGIGVGYAFVQAICTFAVYGLHRSLAPALQVLRYIGAAYLVYLAIHLAVCQQSTGPKGNSAGFIAGFAMQLVNGKIYFYITTLLTAYIVPVYSALWQMLLMGIFVVAVGCTATLTWSFFGLKLQKLYSKYFRIINILLAIALLYCAVGIIRS